MADHVNFEQIGRGSPRRYFLCCYTLHTSIYAMYCCCWLHPCRVSYSFLQGIGSIAQENTTADILVEDQLRPPLDMLAVDLERKLHKPNSWTVLRVISCGIYCQLKLCTDSTSLFDSFWGIFWIKTSCGHLLEIWCLLVLNYVEGTYCVPVFCGVIQRSRQDFMMNIKGSITRQDFFLHCWYTT